MIIDNSKDTGAPDCRYNPESQLRALHEAAFGWALHCCYNNREDAEEVLQNAYLKVLRKRARFSGKSAFKSWFFAVVRNTAKDHFRRNMIRKLRLTTMGKLPHTVASDEPDPASELHREEMQSIFQQGLSKLPERQRTTLHLVFYQDLSLSEVSEVLSISIGSVRKHYERGKKRLRRILERKSIKNENALQSTAPFCSH